MNLSQSYNREDYLKFLEKFLPDFKKDIRVIKIQKLDSVQNIYSLGSCEKLDLQILEFSYKGSGNKRISLTRDGFKIMNQTAIYNSLSIFYSEENDDWRLSLMTTTPEVNEKGKVETKFSNPRRYSFFLGPDAKINTPNQFLINKGSVKDFEDLLSRFNVEIVTKEFFQQYRKLFEKLVSYLDKDTSFRIFTDQNNVDTNSFAKKLLGQIVFLYFLQRKGWLGAKKEDSIVKGDKNFLRSLFNKSREEKLDFFNFYLEPLFYDALNKKTEKAASFYRDYFDCQIPFLNGGLFEPIDKYDWQNQHLNIPNKLFSSNADNPENGEGILDVFDLYNFTVDEGDSIDKEVSVDPEMLGKVFENLIEENMRKGSGTYYTPREIVHYMCQESLINYLNNKVPNIGENIRSLIHFGEFDPNVSLRIVTLNPENAEQLDEALKNVKIVDPACGSGAFPVGILNEIVKARIYLSQFLNVKNNNYDLKKEAIQNSIYGVDIDAGAVEIAKLRLWLSLVVDYNLEDIEPLPNLDYKLMVGDSLIEKLDSGILNKSIDHARDKIIDELNLLKSNFFKESDSKEKKELRERINKLIRELLNYENKKERDDAWDLVTKYRSQTKIFEESYAQQSFAKDEKILTEKLQKLTILKDISETDHFEWHINFNDIFEKGGFDIVIANPPYVSTKGTDEQMKKLLEENYGFADDLYSHFYFRGLELCKDNEGVLSYITSKTFWTIQTKKNVRELLLKNNLIDIYDTANPFESVMVDTCVILVQKNDKQENKIQFLKADGDYSNLTRQEIDKSIYENAINKVIFNPSPENLAIYHKYNTPVSELMKKWWSLINTSKNITKYATQLTKYRDSLRPGDISLLGLITDGGQGLATANNGRYVGVLSTTTEAIKTREARVNKFFEFTTDRKIAEYGSSKETVRACLNKLSEQELRRLFDSFKEKYGRDIFGQGFLYRIVSPNEIKDVRQMKDEEKRGGLSGEQTFVPYDKGDKEGNRWYLRTPYYIDWSIENVKFLTESSGKKGKGMPVVRNPQFNFRAGLCWILTLNEQSEYQKARIKESGVFDVNAMSLFSLSDLVSEKYLVCLLNSFLLFRIKKHFINGSSAFQVNDARQIPIIIPTKEQLADFEDLFDRAYAVKIVQFDRKITNTIADQKLQEIQKELDRKVLKLYSLTSEEIKIVENY